MPITKLRCLASVVHQPIAIRTKAKKMLAHMTSLFLNIVLKFYKNISLKNILFSPGLLPYTISGRWGKCRYSCSQPIISRVLHVVIINCRKFKKKLWLRSSHHLPNLRTKFHRHRFRGGGVVKLKRGNKLPSKSPSFYPLLKKAGQVMPTACDILITD